MLIFCRKPWSNTAAMSCPRFVQNAWKRDLCSNCFKGKEDHAPVVDNRARYLANLKDISKQPPPPVSAPFKSKCLLNLSVVEIDSVGKVKIVIYGVIFQGLLQYSRGYQTVFCVPHIDGGRRGSLRSTVVRWRSKVWNLMSGTIKIQWSNILKYSHLFYTNVLLMS